MERRHLKYATSDPNQPTSSSLTKDGGQTGGCLTLGNTEEVPPLAFSGLLLTKPKQYTIKIPKEKPPPV